LCKQGGHFFAARKSNATSHNIENTGLVGRKWKVMLEQSTLSMIDDSLAARWRVFGKRQAN